MMFLFYFFEYFDLTKDKFVRNIIPNVTDIFRERCAANYIGFNLNSATL